MCKIRNRRPTRRRRYTNRCVLIDRFTDGSTKRCSPSTPPIDPCAVRDRFDQWVLTVLEYDGDAITRQSHSKLVHDGKRGGATGFPFQTRGKHFESEAQALTRPSLAKTRSQRRQQSLRLGHDPFPFRFWFDVWSMSDVKSECTAI